MSNLDATSDYKFTVRAELIEVLSISGARVATCKVAQMDAYTLELASAVVGKLLSGDMLTRAAFLRFVGRKDSPTYRWTSKGLRKASAVQLKTIADMDARTAKLLDQFSAESAPAARLDGREVPSGFYREPGETSMAFAARCARKCLPCVEASAEKYPGASDIAAAQWADCTHGPTAAPVDPYPPETPEERAEELTRDARDKIRRDTPNENCNPCRAIGRRCEICLGIVCECGAATWTGGTCNVCKRARRDNPDADPNKTHDIGSGFEPACGVAAPFTVATGGPPTCATCVQVLDARRVSAESGPSRVAPIGPHPLDFPEPRAGESLIPDTDSGEHSSAERWARALERDIDEGKSTLSPRALGSKGDYPRDERGLTLAWKLNRIRDEIERLARLVRGTCAADSGETLARDVEHFKSAPVWEHDLPSSTECESVERDAKAFARAAGRSRKLKTHPAGRESVARQVGNLAASCEFLARDARIFWSLVIRQEAARRFGPGAARRTYDPWPDARDAFQWGPNADSPADLPECVLDTPGAASVREFTTLAGVELVREADGRSFIATGEIRVTWTGRIGIASHDFGGVGTVLPLSALKLRAEDRAAVVWYVRQTWAGREPTREAFGHRREMLKRFPSSFGKDGS